jgi:hypothetical protein
MTTESQGYEELLATSSLTPFTLRLMQIAYVLRCRRWYAPIRYLLDKRSTCHSSASS